MEQSTSSWWKYLAMLLCLGFPLSAHFVLLKQDDGMLRLLMLFLPLLVIGGWVLLRAPNKPLYLSIIALGGLAIYVIEQHSHSGPAIIFGLPHAAAYIFLTWLFGRTLLSGREPLITRVARRLHGSLLPHIERYTRHVTIAWCVFFVLQPIVSAMLLAFSTLEAWSLFVNVLNAPLIILMFAGEYVYRITKFPDHPRISISRSWHEFARDAVPPDAKTR